MMRPTFSALGPRWQGGAQCGRGREGRCARAGVQNGVYPPPENSPPSRTCRRASSSTSSCVSRSPCPPFTSISLWTAAKATGAQSALSEATGEHCRRWEGCWGRTVHQLRQRAAGEPLRLRGHPLQHPVDVLGAEAVVHPDLLAKIKVIDALRPEALQHLKPLLLALRGTRG